MANSSMYTMLPEPPASEHFRIFLYVLVGFSALMGNTVVIRAVCRESGPKPLSYKLVTNLAVGELGNTVLIPFLFQYNKPWVLGEFLCKTLIPLQIVNSTAINLTLATIAVHRWHAVSTSRLITLSKRRTRAFFLVIWLIGIGIAIPTLVTRKVVKREEEKEFCEEVWSSNAYMHAYTFVFSILVYFLPILTMIVAYTLIGWKLRQHIASTKRKSLQIMNPVLNSNKNGLRLSNMNSNDSKCHSFTKVQPVHNIPENKSRPIPGRAFVLPHNEGNQEAPTTDTQSSSHVCLPTESRAMMELEQDLVKMFYTVVLISVFCYLPYQLVFILWEFGVWQRFAYGNIFLHYFVWMMYLPSALHPLCYGTKSKFFAKAFRLCS